MASVCILLSFKWKAANFKNICFTKYFICAALVFSLLYSDYIFNGYLYHFQIFSTINNATRDETIRVSIMLINSNTFKMLSKYFYQFIVYQQYASFNYYIYLSGLISLSFFFFYFNHTEKYKLFPLFLACISLNLGELFTSFLRFVFLL